MGDFNMEPTNELLNNLKNNYISSDEYLSDVRSSFPSTKPIKKLDYIFVSKDIKIIDSSIKQDIASDHLPYIIDIEI